MADGRRSEAAQRRHVLDGAAQHAAEHVLLDAGVVYAELPRRTNQHLPGDSGLRVERYRVGRGGVGALDVAEFD